MEPSLLDLHRIKEIAIKAGAVILEHYEAAFEVKTKAEDSLLTKADLMALTLITQELKKAYPDIPILSEESKDDLSRLRAQSIFIIEPLDGSKEFIKHNGEFSVNIALVVRQRAILGVVHAPVLHRTFYALKGMGAYEDNPEEANTCLVVSSKLSELNLVSSASHQSAQQDELVKAKQKQIKSRRLMGSAIKGCLVACGEADVYYRFGKTYEWDTAAMQVIVEEAGGIFRELDGKPMIYNRFNLINEKGFFAVNRKENIWTVLNPKL